MKMFLWGTGIVAKEICDIIIIEYIMAFVETNPKEKEFCGIPIIRPECIELGNEDLLIVAVANAVIIESYINERLNLSEKNILFYRLDGLSNPLHYAAKYGKLIPYMKEECFESMLKKMNVDAMLYNSQFICEICEQNGFEYPFDFDEGIGFLNTDSLNHKLDYNFIPDLQNIWCGDWYKKKYDIQI